jgi:hypothetical protein
VWCLKGKISTYYKESVFLKEGVAMDELKAMEERIAILQAELDDEKSKNEILMAQVLKAEDALLEKDLESVGEVIANEDREFWREQLLENREVALGMLNRMKEKVARSEDVSGKEEKEVSVNEPLHNRKIAGQKMPVQGSVEKKVSEGMLRNRAQEIAARDKCTYTEAFRKAESEKVPG